MRHMFYSSLAKIYVLCRTSGFPVPVLWLLALCSVLCGCVVPSTGRVRDAHLLYGRSKGGDEIGFTEEFGPFYEHVETRSGAQRTSFRPFLYTSVKSSPEDNAALHEILWPVFSRTSRGEQYSWRFLVWFGGCDDAETDEPSKWTWLFPLWFSGHTNDGESYAALFPVYGTVRNIFIDRVSFVLFPIWVEMDKGKQHSWSFLWPIFSRTRGGGTDAFRVFPFWGRASREDKYDAYFVMWPIWNSAVYYGDNPGSSWMLFPLAGYVNTENEVRRMFLPPFFSFAYGRGDTPYYRSINCPWPLVVVRDDLTSSKRSFFPFYSRTYDRNGRYESVWYLWPFFRTRTARHGYMCERSFSFFPLYYRSKMAEDSDKDGEYETVVENFSRIWPVYSFRSDIKNNFIKIPDFSLSKRSGGWDRNFLGMFTVFTYGSAGSRYDWNFLWGAYAYGRGEGYRRVNIFPFYSGRTDGEESEWSFLCGLLGRERHDKQRYWKWLWFFGGAPDTAEGTQ